MMKRKPSKNRMKQFNLDETFRQLRTNIEFSQFDTQMKVINIVSTNPNEGKSTVASNLARIYSAKYDHILLIDCDLRNATLHKYLGISNARGLSDFLAHFELDTNIKEYKELQTVHEEDLNSSFQVLTAGSRVPNPQELLSSLKFVNFLKQARQEFDMVIIDCPPCMAVSDAIPVCNASDGTLYVISAKDTDKKMAREAIAELNRNGANIIGAVLTKAEDVASRRYYYYGEGYGEHRDEE